MTEPNRSCPLAWEGLLDRRDLLRVGSLAIAASALPSLAQPGKAADSTVRMATAKTRSVILLWMAGGVTHIDSFDPKPDAPAEVRGTLGTTATTIPGVRFNEALPCLARQAQHLAVIRSYAHGSNDHLLSQAHALSGRRVTMSQLTTEPNIGSIVYRLQGSRAGFPGYMAVPGTTRPGPPPYNMFVSGWLGREYAPFASGGAPRNEDFTAHVPEAAEDEFLRQAVQTPANLDAGRLHDRRSLRERLEANLRRLEGDDTLARNYSGAFAMLTSPAVRRSFDLGQEPEPLRQAYGRTKIGQRCLLARRLVEAGARFVMVDYGYDPEFGNLWDNHCAPVQNQPPICEMVKRPYHLAGTDRACAALLADLDMRGLLAETLVVFLTEFGRTPKINPLGGRDHWGAAGSIFFAGGGTHGGQVIGATDKQGAFTTGQRHSPSDVAATIYQALGIDPNGILLDRQSRPMPVLPEGEAIAGVL